MGKITGAVLEKNIKSLDLPLFLEAISFQDQAGKVFLKCCVLTLWNIKNTWNNSRVSNQA